MCDLLAFSGFVPRVTTDAPATVGVNLNTGSDAIGPVLTLDLNNCDIDAATDTIRPAPACTTTIRLPADWPVGAVQVTCLRPKSPAAALPPDAIALDRRTRTLRLRVPPFDTALILCIRPANE